MYLIDGHNLIGQLQDITLDDPNDEAKLTMAVKRYCMRARIKAEIIFDNGLPGGISKQLSNSDVCVRFAPSGVQADNLLMRRVRDMTNTHSVILVTSDDRILRLCHAYGVETLFSEEFALMLGFRPVERDDETQPGKKRIEIVYDKDPDPNVTVQEVAYWLPIFKRRLIEAQQAQEAAREAARAIRKQNKVEVEQKVNQAHTARTIPTPPKDKPGVPSKKKWSDYH